MTLAITLNQLEARLLDDGFTTPRDVPAALNGALKRSFDLTLAISLFIFILPLLATIAILIRLDGQGPVFFSHTRCGRGGRGFKCYKFRTMRTDAAQVLERLLRENPEAAAEWEKTQKLQHDPRVTTLGAFLRRTSLDELPQLINIIRGEMSIIGPRPVTFEELTRYGSKVTYYTAARPGVTGMWQVNGRNNLSYDERIAYDIEYAKGWTFQRDIQILLKTVPAVLASEGAF